MKINSIFNEKEEEILLTPATKVIPEKDAWSEETINFVNELKDTLAKSDGVGLAANQIWTNPTTPPPRIFVAKVRGQIKEFINPILKTSGGTNKFAEACLSIPGKEVVIKRSKNVTITYSTTYSTEQTTEKYYDSGDPFVPRILQHENDHLNGKLIWQKK